MAGRISDVLSKSTGICSSDEESRRAGGVDSSLVALFLKMSPEERLHANDNAIRGISELRNAYKKQQRAKSGPGRNP